MNSTENMEKLYSIIQVKEAKYHQAAWNLGAEVVKKEYHAMKGQRRSSYDRILRTHGIGQGYAFQMLEPAASTTYLLHPCGWILPYHPV
jgi:hypothetical protein